MSKKKKKKKKEKKKRTCRIVEVAVPDDCWVKQKESEKRDKYLDLAGGLKKTMNMKVMVILVVIDVLGTVNMDWYGDWRT